MSSVHPRYIKIANEFERRMYEPMNELNEIREIFGLIFLRSWIRKHLPRKESREILRHLNVRNLENISKMNQLYMFGKAFPQSKKIRNSIREIVYLLIDKNVKNKKQATMLDANISLLTMLNVLNRNSTRSEHNFWLKTYLNRTKKV